MRRILIVFGRGLAGGVEQRAGHAEIKALITTAMDAAVVVLIPQFEKASAAWVSFELRSIGRLGAQAPRRRVRRHDSRCEP